MHGRLVEIGDNSGDTETVSVTTKPPYQGYMGATNTAFDEARLRREDPRWFVTEVSPEEAAKRAAWAKFNASPLSSDPPEGSKIRTSGGSVTHIVHPRAVEDTGPIEVKLTPDDLARSIARTERAAALEPAERAECAKIGAAFRASLDGAAPKAG